MELSRDERERILNAEVHRATKDGVWKVVNTSPTSASLAKRFMADNDARGIGCMIHIALATVTAGIWIIVWAVWAFLILPILGPVYPESLFIEIHPDGTIERTTDGWFGGTVQDFGSRGAG